MHQNVNDGGEKLLAKPQNILQNIQNSTSAEKGIRDESKWCEYEKRVSSIASLQRRSCLSVSGCLFKSTDASHIFD